MEVRMTDDHEVNRDLLTDLDRKAAGIAWKDNAGIETAWTECVRAAIAGQESTPEAYTHSVGEVLVDPVGDLCDTHRQNADAFTHIELWVDCEMAQPGPRSRWHLYDSETAEDLGRATPEQIAASNRAPGGGIRVDPDGSPIPMGEWEPPGSRDVYVAP